MNEAEITIRKLIALKLGRLSKRTIERKSEIVSYGGKFYDLYKEEMSRPIHVAALYSCYGHLSTLVIEIQGSPPKGLMIVTFPSYDKDPLFIYVEDSNFRLRRINLRELKLKDPNKYEELATAIHEFIRERKIPYFKPSEKKESSMHS